MKEIMNEYERVILTEGESFIFLDHNNVSTFIMSYREDVKTEVEICYSGFNLFVDGKYIGKIFGEKFEVLRETTKPTKIYFRKEM